MKVLVTGGAGFLGRYIVERLLLRHERVSVFQRSEAPELAAQGVRVIPGDLTDGESVAAAVKGHEAVIHVAAKAGVWGRRADFEAINIGGTRHVLAACRQHGVRWLVHTSTPSVVFTGEAIAGADESLPYGRNWLCHYAETKALAEQEVLAACSERLRVCALRPHLIWGLGDPHLLPRLIARARTRRLSIVGDAYNRVDVTHVRNAAAAHVLALDALMSDRAVGKAFFLSQGEPVVLWDWINDFIIRLGMAPISRRIGARSAYRIGAVAEWMWRALPLPGEPPMTRFVATELAKDHWFSIEAARRELEYRPEAYPTTAGVDEYVDAFRAAKAG